MQAGTNRSRERERERERERDHHKQEEEASKQAIYSITEYVLLETQRVLAVAACGVRALSRYFAGEGCAVALLRGLDGFLADGLVHGVARVVAVHAVATVAVPDRMIDEGRKEGRKEGRLGPFHIMPCDARECRQANGNRDTGTGRQVGVVAYLRLAKHSQYLYCNKQCEYCVD
jgi:hypothetical protein